MSARCGCPSCALSRRQPGLRPRRPRSAGPGARRGVCGGGVHGSDAIQEVGAFAERLGGLVVTSLSGKGSVPEMLPYAAGVLNPLGSAAAIELIQEADLIIWCGAKVSQTTGMSRTLPRPEQAAITIGFDPLEHGRSFRPTVALLGDVRDTVLALDAAKGASRAGANPEWDVRIAGVKARCDAAKAEEMASSQLPILPPRIMAEIAARLGRTMSSCPTPRSRRAGSRATSRPNRSGGSSCPRAGRAGRRS